jgi:hypothetical protein
LLAVASAVVAASAVAVTLLFSAAASPPPAFAVTLHHDGSASLKINRRSSIADVNRKLAAMGIRTIDRRANAAGHASSPIPSCSSIPPGWTGTWILISGEPTAGDSGTTSAGGIVAPGTWHLAICTPDNLGDASSGSASNTGAG